MGKITKVFRQTSNSNMYKEIVLHFDGLKTLVSHHPFLKSNDYSQQLESLSHITTQDAKFLVDTGDSRLVANLGKIASLTPMMAERDKAIHGLHRIIVPLNRQEDMCRLNDAIKAIRKIVYK